MAPHDLHAAAEQLLCRVIGEVQHQIVTLGKYQQKQGTDNHGGGGGQQGSHEPACGSGLQEHPETDVVGQQRYQIDKHKDAGQRQAFPKLPFVPIKQVAYVITAPAGHVQEEQRIACG